MLADTVELVVGVDTHKEAHTAAIVDRLGGVAESFEFAADSAGYRRALGTISPAVYIFIAVAALYLVGMSIWGYTTEA